MSDYREQMISLLWRGLRKRLWTAWYRLINWRVTFGPRCDLRPGLVCLVSGNGSIRFGEKCIVDRSMTIEARGELTIGDRVIFGHHCTLGVHDCVTIGSDSMIGEMVSIRDHDHRFADPDRPVRTQGMVTSPITIGRDVWIGGKATIIKGVTIGDGAIIGANTVVTRSLPARAIAVGAPARIVGYRGTAAPQTTHELERPSVTA